MDRFKHVNDTRGHAVGDRALVQTAQLLRSAVREVATVARWGGDESLSCSPRKHEMIEVFEKGLA